MKRIFIAVIVIALAVLVGSKISGTKTLQPTETYGQTGYIEDRDEAAFNEGLYLVPEKSGTSVPESVKLAFDEQSQCTFQGQTIQCVALNVTIDIATKGKRAFVRGDYTDGQVLVHTLELVPAVDERFGFVRSVKHNGQILSIEIDAVEFLSGDEAIQGAMKDSGCPMQEVEGCVPSLNNGFYIRNLATTTETFALADNARINLFKSPGAPDLETVDANTLRIRFENPASLIVNSSPFMYRLDGTAIIVLEQQYLP